MLGYGVGLCAIGGFPMMPMLFMGFLIYYFLIKPNRQNENQYRTHNFHPTSTPQMNLLPKEILDRSFALGELTEVEYLRKKDLLRQ